MEMTLELLESLPKLLQNKRTLEIRFDKLKRFSGREESECYGSSVIFDYKSGFPKPQAVTGFDIEEYEKKYDDFVIKINRLQEKITFITDWIHSIEDETTMYVLEAYYIDGKKWGDIAREIGYKGKEYYPRLYIRDAFLKEKGIK